MRPVIPEDDGVGIGVGYGAPGGDAGVQSVRILLPCEACRFVQLASGLAGAVSGLLPGQDGVAGVQGGDALPQGGIGPRVKGIHQIFQLVGGFGGTGGAVDFAAQIETIGNVADVISQNGTGELSGSSPRMIAGFRGSTAGAGRGPDTARIAGGSGGDIPCVIAVADIGCSAYIA